MNVMAQFQPNNFCEPASEKYRENMPRSHADQRVQNLILRGNARANWARNMRPPHSSAAKRRPADPEVDVPLHRVRRPKISNERNRGEGYAKGAARSIGN
jgi:hypothetical protein